MEARVFVTVENDEYYCDRVGPGQYWVYGTYACDAEGAMWVYTVRTDPSPKVGSVVEFETKVLNIVETEE